MRALDDVVLGLRTLRVTGEAASLAQHAEVLAPGEQLVHVRLVAGVEHDGVAGRVEHPVDGDGRLDDTEVGTQVTAGLRYVRDEERPDLRCELDELLLGELSRSRGPVMVSRMLMGSSLGVQESEVARKQRFRATP